MRSIAGSKSLDIRLLCLIVAISVYLFGTEDAFGLTPKEQRALENRAKHYDIPIGSTTHFRLHSRLYGSVADQRREHFHRRKKPPANVAVHLRGDSGTSIPKEILKPQTVTSKSAPLILEKEKELLRRKKKPRGKNDTKTPNVSWKDISSNFATAIRQHNTPRALSPCLSSSTMTKRNKSPFAKLDTAPDVMLDALFVKPGVPGSREFMAGGYEDLFGGEVILYPYTTTTNDWVSLQASKHGVQCLPTRIYVTKSKISIHTGLNALKFYEHLPAQQRKEALTNRRERKLNPKQLARLERKKERKKRTQLKKQKMHGKLHPLVEKRLDEFLNPGGEKKDTEKMLKGKKGKKKSRKVTRKVKK